jgi:hypothetical protein
VVSVEKYVFAVYCVLWPCLTFCEGTVKAKLTLRTGHEGPVVNKRQSYAVSLTSDVDVGGWLPRSGRFTTEETNPVPIAHFVRDASE